MAWDFAWLSDPTAWIGLLTLILLEIVLGIDNLVFISILSSRLPDSQKRKAFTTGLSLALILRLILLSTIAWIVSLTNPLFTLFGQSFSAKDLILVLGGIFLLLKGTMELHERLEGGISHGRHEAHQAVFWQVVVQILILDAVFSLDSVITSVGMVKELPVMMLAVIIAMGVMLLAARPLTAFVDAHPTVIILCLGFLLMIGLSLIMDGLGFHVPKGYLYAAIGFSVLVELFNQIALRNRRRRITSQDLRESTARIVLNLLGGKTSSGGDAQLDIAAFASEDKNEVVFAPEERNMVARVIRLGGRTARYIMTPRHRVQWLDLSASYEEILHLAGTSGLPCLPVQRSDTDEALGVINTGDLFRLHEEGGKERIASLVRPAPAVFEYTPLPDMLDVFRVKPAQLAFVLDEYGTAIGIVTPLDILSALAGHMGEVADDPTLFQQADGSWIMPGRLSVDDVESSLGIDIPEDVSYSTLAGLLLKELGHIPVEGEGVNWSGWHWEVLRMDGLRIGEVRVTRVSGEPAAR